MRIFRLQSLGIFRSETPGRLAPAGWDFRLGFFAWELPFKIVLRLETFAWDLSLGNFRLIAFVWDPSFGNFHFGTFALELALRNFRLEFLA